MGYSEVKTKINNQIKTNGNQEITGAILNDVLNDVLDYSHDGGGVSVSQNTSTGHTDINIGDETIPIVSTNEMEALEFVLGYTKSIVNPSYTTGKYINYVGNESSYAGAQESDAISLSKGQTIIVKGSSIANAYGVIAVKKNALPYDVVARGDESVSIYSYTATDDCKIILSSEIGQITFVVICDSAMIDKINLTVDLLDKLARLLEYSEIAPTVNFTSGSYINYLGYIMPFAYGQLSNEIPIKAGDVIIVDADDVESAYGLISIKKDTEPYEVVVRGNGTAQRYSYVATKDCNIILSSHTGAIKTVKICNSEMLENILSEITVLDSLDDILSNTPITLREYIYNDGLIHSNFAGSQRYDVVSVILAKKLHIEATMYPDVTYIGLYSNKEIVSENVVRVISPSDFVDGKIDIDLADNERYMCLSCSINSEALVNIIETRKISEVLDSIYEELSEMQPSDIDSHLTPIDDDTPFRVIKETAGLTSAFETWGFIGDSLASGEIWGYLNEPKDFSANQSDKIINSDGTISDASNYNISTIIQVTNYKPKIVVEFGSNTGLSNNMCVIAKCNSSGVILSVGTLGGTATKYTYSLNLNEYVLVCYPANNVPSVRCVSYYVEDNYEISWGQFMCRLCGSNGVNYSIGGGTAKKFVLSEPPFGQSNGLSKLLSDTQKQGYIIAFGVNDNDNAMYSGGNVTDIEDIAADIDMSDSTQNADTFAGWYARIIQDIKAQNWDSKIFLVTIPEARDDYDEINTIIRAMPTIFTQSEGSLFVLDLKQYATINLWYEQHFRLNGAHFNGQGYQYIAYQLCTYIDWLMQKNPNYFKGLSLIGKALTNNPT